MSLPSDFPCRNVIAVADLHTHVDLKKIVERTYIAEFEREPKVRVCMCDTIVAHACTYMHICRNLRFHSSCCSCISSLPLQTCIYRVCVCVCVLRYARSDETDSETSPNCTCALSNPPTSGEKNKQNARCRGTITSSYMPNTHTHTHTHTRTSLVCVCGHSTTKMVKSPRRW